MSKITNYIPSAVHQTSSGLDMLKRHGFRPTTDAQRKANQQPKRPEIAKPVLEVVRPHALRK